MATAARTPRDRYSAVAIALHWVIAAAILAMLAMGLIMAHGGLAPADKFKIYQLHKSVGLTILALVVVRLLWRLTHRPPPLPADMPAWEQHAAEGTHGVLYLFMLGLPLAGWALVSVAPLNLPTLWFGLFRVPDLSFLTALASKPVLAPIFTAIHRYGAYVLIAILALHVGAALRHYLVVHDFVLQRMVPGLPRLGSRRSEDLP